MDNRKTYLSSAKLCRFCLTQDESLQNLYDRKGTAKYQCRSANRKLITLPLKILSCISIEAMPSDKMPAYICKRCSFFIDVFFEYKQMCRVADEKIVKYIQSGTELEPPCWPQILTKTFRLAAKDTSDVGVVKTVVEGGATVEVTSHDTSEGSDDDEENVYNVKIGDGSDEGTSACVKVITSQEEKPTSKRGKDLEKGENLQVQAGASDDQRWACDECDCTYPLQQLLELHKASKHRERTVACDQCDAQFFRNADLQSHMVRHSDKTPFQCVMCDKKFKRLVLLKRHERLTHGDFVDEGKPEASYVCPQCNKKFHKKSSLDRHYSIVHSATNSLSCKYCPERFSTVAKLKKHVFDHAGIRPYPCKYCEKSFSKSHHYTRHVRLKHRDCTIGTARGSLGITDQYHCDQCEVSFASQDELIYHSAIHATQNLTCPLCQEKFANVDDVTTHIKSHVNGMEFMCDYCELVFTSKQKLDSHLVTHNEEISAAMESGQDDNSMEMYAEDDDDDNNFNVKEEGDHMVVEVKKTDSFMLRTAQVDEDAADTLDNTNSEESETEAKFIDLDAVDCLPAEVSATLTIAKPPVPTPVPVAMFTARTNDSPNKPINNKSQISSILLKAEEVKRKAVRPTQEIPPEKPEIVQKKEKPVCKDDKLINKGDGNNSASEKSLRLLEKELQELKRTTRNEAVKAPTKAAEPVRSTGRRPQLHTSTPKLRLEEKKSQTPNKPATTEKKALERRAVKENKEPKETKANDKETKVNDKESKVNDKESKVNDKESKVNDKESKGNDKESKVNASAKEDPKEKETSKGIVKNGAGDKSTDEVVRRSTRPCKVKDYAKMVRTDRSNIDSDDDTDDDDDEYMDVEKHSENRVKRRLSSVKPAAHVTPKVPNRKRGRPRKQPLPLETPAKIRKEGVVEDKVEEDDNAEKKSNAENKQIVETIEEEPNTDTSKQAEQKGVLVSPSGQTLKKVPVRALPPGVKALPLPITQRPMGPRELCEMQIGKKMVKVQKIVMTKAEVEAMAKKGLVEMKGNTMVLKQGIKLPTSDAGGFKSLVGESNEQEILSKNDKAAPTRCEFNEAENA